MARRGAFFGALMQLRTAGAPIDDATVAFIREAVIPDTRTRGGCSRT